MSAQNVLSDIKKNLKPYLGKEVVVKANRGRKRIVEKSGVLDNTYPKLFTVKINEKSVERKLSFTYADILTEAVVLTVPKNGKKIVFNNEV